MNHAAPPAISHRQIEVFRAVMSAGGVTAAAALLHSSQPTLSRELARLEQLLGYALFERQSGRLKPTARALALSEEVDRAYAGLDQVIARAQALGRGEDELLSVLALPALVHALLPGACRRFAQRHPAARLSLTPQESPLLEDWMSAQRHDLGLGELGQALPGCELETLARLDEVCVLPAGHALLTRSRLRLEDFEDQAFVSLAAEDPYRRLLDRMFAEAGVRRQLRLETHSAAAVCALVSEGLGVAVVNPLTALACASERLQIRPLALSLPFEVQLLRPLHRPRQALAEAFVRAIREELALLETRLPGR